ncbi:peptidase M55 [Virgibacillus phasianinus]|uniref:Peptidase M55 n=1 Tax=Virgibacillus phasianinus TaxID=2017483 RepID=A0A220U3M9_9BACI|nr:M55 family metallopeptidase [Virgibacillus phasianinus]ASK62333.1 peptidase M55 [Virgibacillus phasianinus]
MKVFISADIEGVSGVVHGEHTARNGREHDLARRLMTGEVNAGILGALQGGAKEVVVNDSHGTMRNIVQDQLSPEAELIIGSPKKLAMMEGIDSTFDVAFFIGYHTRMGTSGILNHTFSGRTIKSIIINGVEYGEFGLNALVAGYYGVPVVFVSGCNLLAKEAVTYVPNIQQGVVKKTINRTTAQNLHPEKAQSIIKEKSTTAMSLKDKIDPFVVEGPLTVEVEFLNTGLADAAEILPVVKRITPLSVSFETDDVLECYRFIRSLIMMASSTFSS